MMFATVTRLSLLALSIGSLPSLTSAQYGGGGGSSSSATSASTKAASTSTKASSTSAAAQAASTGTVHDVDVGENGFTFSPNTLTAAQGDTVNFHFYPGDHSVSQSTFDAPCVPAPGNAISSGFINPTGTGEASTMFSVTINDTTPIWIYCSQVTHCQTGMAMVINPSSSNSSQSITNYIAAAKKTTTSTSPAAIFGGVIVPNKDSDDSSSASSASSSSSPSATSSAAATTTAASSGAEAGKSYNNVFAIVAGAMLSCAYMLV